MLTIKELAGFVGVTVKAVRHYHKIGLLPEAPRDSSGYRRYDADAVVELIKIKALADAGVPLARAGELLRAEPEEFAAAIRQIDADLGRRARELQRHRRRIRQLGAGDSLVLPPEVVEYVNRLRELSMSERIVDLEREGWILVAARAPDRVVDWIKLKMASLEDVDYLTLYRTFDQAWDWPPDDPRLPELADAVAEFLATEAHDEAVQTDDARLDDMAVALLDAQVVSDASPAWSRLKALLEERGWAGWTNVRPADQR